MRSMGGAAGQVSSCLRCSFGAQAPSLGLPGIAGDTKRDPLISCAWAVPLQVRYMSSTDAKVEQMFQILLDPKEKGTEKKQKVQIALDSPWGCPA